MGRSVFRALGLAVFAASATCACAARHAPAPRPPDLSSRLAEADALVAAGCFDCLREALDSYQTLRTVTGAAASSIELATNGAFRAAALLALRQHELGMVDDGYLKIAKELLASQPCGAWGCESAERQLEVIGLLPAGAPGVMARPPDSDSQMADRLRLFRNRDVWLPLLRYSAPQDLLSAYVWLAFACGPAGNMTRNDAASTVTAFEDVPLVAFKRGTCLTIQPDDLQRLLNADPRFAEIAYPLGLAALGRLKTGEAEAAFERAYAWHPQWPALTQSLANLAIAGEDFERALGFYEKTLSLESGAVEAVLGRVRALTYLGRYEASIAATDQLLQGRLYLGDARYWRAMDEYQLDRFDQAWSDIEESAKLLVNALVPKLAGLIAYRRHELDVARVKFEESLQRNAMDCETSFYLGVTLAELRTWSRSADTFKVAVSCLDQAERELRLDIDRIRRSDDSPTRQARLIASREQRIGSGRRMIAQATFNTAVAYLNLSRDADARPYAEKVADDEQFGERARELLSRFR